MVLDNERFVTSELANIIQVLDEHFRVALSAVKIVTGAVVDWLEKGTVISAEALAKATEAEVKGDELKETILNALAAANTLMQREDLLRLVFYNDKLIDGAEIACHHLGAIMSSWTPKGELKNMVAELGRLILEIATQQREAVRFLSINIENAISKAAEICRLEKAIDAVVREIWTLLYPSDTPIPIILRMSDFVNVLEEIANFSEDAANTIRGLSLTLNT